MASESLTAATSTPGSTPEADATDEGLLHSSQSATWHATPQAIRFPQAGPNDESLGETDRTHAQRWFDAGKLDPAPVEVVARNRQPDAVRVRSQWDGQQLHLDVCPTQRPRLGARAALGAVGRHYRDAPIRPWVAIALGTLFWTAVLAGLYLVGVL